MRVLNAAQMREADRITIDEIGIGSLVLMECAGRQVVATLEERVEDLADSRIAVLCGPGNNGGDGFVVARTLLQAGHDVAVFLVGRAADVSGDARINLDILGRLGHTLVEIGNEQEWELHASDVSACDLVVDALFGTGLSRPLTGLFETIVQDVNASTLPVVAIDLPSGLSGSTADIIGPAIEADLTVTFAAPKLPHVLPPAEALCGDVVTVEIGIPSEVVEALDGPRIDVITRDAVRRLARAARVRHAQGRLRPRPHRRRLAGPHRRGLPGGDGRAALRRRARDGRRAGVRRADHRVDGRRVHDAAAARGRRRARRRGRARADPRRHRRRDRGRAPASAPATTSAT